MPPCCTMPLARKPLILFSTEGGMDIEEVAAEKPAATNFNAIISGFRFDGRILNAEFSLRT
jgi:succinyl-CoA synthetase beta subunit